MQPRGATPGRARRARPSSPGRRATSGPRPCSSRPRSPRRGSRRPTARRRRAPAARSRSRSSATGKRFPVVQQTCERASRRVLGVTAASSTSSDSSGGRSRTRRRAPEPARWRPRRAGRSARRRSSRPRPPGRRPRPARTMLQPFVVEVVSESDSGGAPTTAASLRAHPVAQLERALEVGGAAAPALEVGRSCSAIASAVGRASGPIVPAFRYARRSSTGNCALASSNVIRSSPPPARGRTGACRRTRRLSSGQRCAWPDLAPRTSTWSIHAIGCVKPHRASSGSVEERSRMTLKSPATTSTSSGSAKASAKDAARSSSASATRQSWTARPVQVRAPSAPRCARRGRRGAPSPSAGFGPGRGAAPGRSVAERPAG